MAPTPNPPAFEAAVREYLEPSKGQFNYEQMLLTFLSVDRFRQWAAVLHRSHPIPGARFLSSGCGFAGSLLAYRDAGAISAVGVEVDDDYVRFGKLRVAELDDTEVLAYDGRRLPFPDDAFDVIESMDVIEHTPDDMDYVRELVRVLAPGGVILLVTPNRLWPVEQHLGIWGPPWLPIGVADALFGLLSKLPFLGVDRRFRYAKLRGMRTHNVSLRRLRAIAKELDLFLRVLRPEDHGADWPLPLDPSWVRRLRDSRLGKFLAPTRTLAVTLQRS